MWGNGASRSGMVTISSVRHSALENVLGLVLNKLSLHDPYFWMYFQKKTREGQVVAMRGD